MSASGKTPNFDFPLYEVQDNFAPLTSFNQLSNKADQQLALVKSSADTAEALSSANEQDIQALETWKAGLMAQLSNILAPRKLIINTTIQGTSQEVNSTLCIIGDLLYCYSHNNYKIKNMMRIPIEDADDAFPLSSTPEKVWQDMGDNVMYPLGVQSTLLYKVEGDVFVSRERSVALIRQNSITYFCIRMSNKDYNDYDEVITAVNFCIPRKVITGYPL